MGGKNAIIVDDDADLDEAVRRRPPQRLRLRGAEVLGLLAGDRARRGLRRLPRPAGRGREGLPVGPADDPDTAVGPVIDAEARERIEEYKRIAATEGQVVLSVDVGPLAERGSYVGPQIVAGRPARRPDRPGGDLRAGPGRPPGPGPRRRPRDRQRHRVRPDRRPLLAQPGQHRPGEARVPGRQPLHQPPDHRRPGRSPAVRRVQALGHRHQGRRAGLLCEFLLTRTITENTLRRGFAPESDDPADLQASVGT